LFSLGYPFLQEFWDLTSSESPHHSFHTLTLAYFPHLTVDTLPLCFLMDSPSISTL